MECIKTTLDGIVGLTKYVNDKICSHTDKLSYIGERLKDDPDDSNLNQAYSNQRTILNTLTCIQQMSYTIKEDYVFSLTNNQFQNLLELK